MTSRGTTLAKVSSRRVVAEILVVALALALLVAAKGITMAWLERRFDLHTDESSHLVIDRLALVLPALAILLFARRPIGLWVDRVGTGGALATCFRYLLALGMALVASEIGLRILKLPRRYDVGTPGEALGEFSPRYGWLFKASKSVTVQTGGRQVRYDFNADHNRAESVSDLPDPSLPTILFVGESIAFGHGLEWEETLPAIVGKALGLQVVNLGCDGYASDQAFLRLYDELPRFQHPVAIVSLFLPLMISRVERVDHPRLVFEGDDVKLVPPGLVQNLRLTQAFRESFNFRREWAIETTEETFRRTAQLAKARSAKAIFVAPYLGCLWPRIEGYAVQDLLVKHGFTVVDPHFGFQGIPGDDHPDAPSTRRLAEAVIAELQTELAER